MIQSILLPIDFSEHSIAAVKQAGALARRFHSYLTLLHVSEFPPVQPLAGPLGFGISSPETARAEHLKRQQKQLNEFGATELDGISVKRIVCCGDPAKSIVQRAQDIKADLILMSTHGRGAFRRFLLGSVTAKVLHDADCPVWTSCHLAPGCGRPVVDFRKVMCAMSFGHQGVKTIRWAAEFAGQFGARLVVVHSVLDHPPSLPDRFMFQWREQARWGAEDRIRTLLLDLGIQADVLIVSDGDVAGSVGTAARDQDAGLLVIGRTSAGPNRRLGSHTYSLICNAPCPVVSI